jgi:hypothetical protein
MSMVMFVIGCGAVMVGAVMVAFGIPVSEFSFGNTLIVSGATLASGGLIVITVSAVVSQLQRIAEALAGRAPAARPAEVFETPAEARTAPARVPFPPKAAAMSAAMPVAMPAATREPWPEPAPLATDLDAEEQPAQSFAPGLRNPEAPPVTVEDDVSLSPHYEGGEARPAANGSAGQESLHEPPQPPQEPPHEPAFDAGWRSAPPPAPPRQPSGSYFDSMWPAKPKTAPASERQSDVAPDRMPDLPPRDRETVSRAPAAEPRGAPQRSVAVLKSGVVDGMGYTLYVDGSIEAELPQGTLRFASIDELRSHLEKTS